MLVKVGVCILTEVSQHGQLQNDYDIGNDSCPNFKMSIDIIYKYYSELYWFLARM